MSVVDAWKKFTMLECVQFIGSALKAMKDSTLNACWRPLWPACVRFAKGSRGVDDGEILLLAHAVGGQGFDDMSMKDVDELLADTVLDDEDLCGCVADNSAEGEEEEDCDIAVQKLEEGLAMAERLAEYFLAHDPNTARAVSFKNDLKYCVARYNEAYKQLKNVSSDDSSVGATASKRTSSCNEDTSNDLDDQVDSDEVPLDRNDPPKRKRCRVIYDSE